MYYVCLCVYVLGGGGGGDKDDLPSLHACLQHPHRVLEAHALCALVTFYRSSSPQVAFQIQHDHVQLTVYML